MRNQTIVLALLSAGLAGHAAANEVAPRAARSYGASIALKGATALAFDIDAPRIEAKELSKMRAKPELLAALHEKHFSRVGALRADRAFLLAGHVFGPGAYDLGLRIDAAGALSLVVTRGDETTNIPLASRQTDASVSRLVVAALPEADVEQFQLEVRIGDLLGTAAIDLSGTRVVVKLNNDAHDLLALPQRSADDVARARTLAERANAMTGSSNPLILDTLALALFHSGDVPSAIATQKMAIQRIEPDYEVHRAAMIGRLKAYQTPR
jgi:hypothetical protein